MKLYTLSNDSEILVANTNRKEFNYEIKKILENDLLGSIESLKDNKQKTNTLELQ